MWNTHPTLEVTLGLTMNLALVLLFQPASSRSVAWPLVRTRWAKASSW